MSKFQAGDAVRVLSYDDIKSQFKRPSVLPSGCSFPVDMKKYCGQIKIIDHVALSKHEDCTRYYLDGVEAWTFTHEMLELAEVETELSFEDLMNIK